ncbi:hypothetical protein TNIN_420151 [Trichonephila inaurata madagascariensis]|uniref:Uncharacterized protein n=1 Tax=Trichonephila inaurata madagascariensis TaxID=2747483 RepID=A0A8X7BTS4_9ARAC|nr:hypothetical protein TNIN_420151 [Trichonephila inaurata madagascariensis]
MGKIRILAIRAFAFKERGRISRAFQHRKFCFSSYRSLRLPLRRDSSSRLRREQTLVSELISFACLRLHSLCT